MWGSRKPGIGGGSGNPPGTQGARGWPRVGPAGVGAHLAGAGPGVDPHCPGRGRRAALTFLLPQTVAFIGIEIDLDRPRFAPSFFATSRVATPYSLVFCACFSVIPLARRQK